METGYPLPGYIPDPAYDRENARGMSYDATVFAYNRAFDTSDFSTMSTTDVDVFGNPIMISLSNHSYGVECGWEELPGETPSWIWYGTPSISQVEDWKFGAYYQGICDVWDEVVYLKQTVLPVFAAGDDHSEGPSGSTLHTVYGSGIEFTTIRNRDGKDDAVSAGLYDSIVPHGCSKNVLTVAAAANAGFNGGPTDDGRIKPDLQYSPADFVATKAGNTTYGYFEGSSVATAAVTSNLNLLVARYYEHHGADYPLLASTMKAMMLGGDSGIDGPDYEGGWDSGGSVRWSLMAIHPIASSTFTSKKRFWRIREKSSFRFTITADQGGQKSRFAGRIHLALL